MPRAMVSAIMERGKAGPCPGLVNVAVLTPARNSAHRRLISRLSLPCPRFPRGYLWRTLTREDFIVVTPFLHLSSLSKIRNQNNMVTRAYCFCE